MKEWGSNSQGTGAIITIWFELDIIEKNKGRVKLKKSIGSSMEEKEETLLQNVTSKRLFTESMTSKKRKQE